MVKKTVKDTAFLERLRYWGERQPEKQTNKVISDRGLNDVKKMKLSDEMSKEATLYREVKESLSGEVTFDLRVD